MEWPLQAYSVKLKRKVDIAEVEEVRAKLAGK